MEKIILVTGGSRGIGAATSLLAAKRGYAVGVNYNSNQEAAEKVVSSIEEIGGKAVAIQADISSEQEVVAMYQTLDQKLGKVTALVNNAGILETQMRVEEMNADRLNRIFQINITGSFLCAREAILRMSTKKGGQGGSIVNVSSGAARSGSPGEYVDYAASKGALDTMTTGLSLEVAEEGIRVNGVRPGLIYTDIHASGGEANRVDRLKEIIPLKRGGQPIEVAQAILWFLSEESSYSTGSFLDMTGGK